MIANGKFSFVGPLLILCWFFTEEINEARVNSQLILMYCCYIEHFVVVQSLSHVRLYCNPMDQSPPGSSVHGISQARILEWITISSSRASWTRVSCVSCIEGRVFTLELPEKPHCWYLAWLRTHSARKSLSLRIWQELSAAIPVERIKSLGKNVKGISGY